MCSVILLLIKCLNFSFWLYIYIATAITYLDIKSTVGKVPILLLLWFFSHELLDTRYISSLRTHQIDTIIITLSMRTYLHLGGESVMVCKGREYNFYFLAPCAIWWEFVVYSHDL